MRIVHLAPHLSQPQIHRRVQAFADAGYSQRVLHFERDYLPYPDLPCETVSLGRTGIGSYGQRIAMLLKSVGTVRQAMADADVVFTYNADMLWLAAFARSRALQRVVLAGEIHDIRGVLLEGKKAAMLRKIDAWATAKSDLMVVTSPQYISGYYHDMLGLRDSKFQVIENKLSLGDAEAMRSAVRSERPTRITFSGVLRCQRSCDILSEIARRGEGAFEVHVHGKFVDVDAAPLQATPNVFYHGPFSLPGDYGRIYDACDVVWSCYPYTGKAVGNWRWARTNRYYEALFFGKAQIAQQGTGDAEAVLARDAGWAIDLSDIGKAAQTVLDLTPQAIAAVSEHVRSLPKAEHTYTDEHSQLCATLESLVVKRKVS